MTTEYLGRKAVKLQVDSHCIQFQRKTYTETQINLILNC